MFRKCVKKLEDNSLVSRDLNVTNGFGFGLQMTKVCMHE